MAPICVRADREVQGSICECLTLPDNLRRTSGPIEVLDTIFPPFLEREKSGLNRAKNPVVWARLKEAWMENSNFSRKKTRTSDPH